LCEISVPPQFNALGPFTVILTLTVSLWWMELAGTLYPSIILGFALYLGRCIEPILHFG
jgi:hypothetical protein